MKKLAVVILILVIVISGCSSGSSKTEGPKIGIIQYIEHPALDQARDGFLQAIEDAGIEADVDVQSAQGDITMAKTISEKFVSSDYDLIFAIATPAAEMAMNATAEIPILFTAVTDPVSAHLVESWEEPNGNITGTSDMIDVREQLALFEQIDPNIKTIGIVYSADEANSAAQLELAKDAAKELNLTVEALAIQNISDLPQVTQSVAAKSDGMYIFSDNKIASSISLVADTLKEKKLPSVCAEPAHVEGGGLISKGISYFDLGVRTGEMANMILSEGKAPSEIPVEKAENLKKVFNEETLEALGLDKNLPVFQDGEAIQ